MNAPKRILKAFTIAIALLAALAGGSVVLSAPRAGTEPVAAPVSGEQAPAPTGEGRASPIQGAGSSPTPPPVVSGTIDPSRLSPELAEERSGKFDLKCVTDEPDPDKCPGWAPVSDARP